MKTIVALGLSLFAATVLAQTEPGRLLAIEGRVEVARAGVAAWGAGVTNQILQNGDRVRTGLRSRATIQLSDKSIVRLNEVTTMEVRSPQSSAAGASFEVKSGATYFFNRERPGRVEFRTPVASGAIRGTEFHLLVNENGRTEMALLDGAVELSNEHGTENFASGEAALVEPGQPPRKTALLEATSIIQWVLYYPAIVDVDELGLSNAERDGLSESIRAYRAGNLLAAEAALPTGQPASPAAQTYRAALLLAVGQVTAATQLVQSVSTPVAEALRQMVTTVQGRPFSRGTNLSLATEWMAESCARQAQSNLEGAWQAAQQAVRQSPRFGFALARQAELEFGFGRSEAARRSITQALIVSPQNAQALATRGFIRAAQNRFAAAERSFERAIELDPALANAWLGRGLIRIRRGQGEAGRQDLQVAATLEPQRSIIRSYLGKAWSHTRQIDVAEKELQLAKKLDENDPTPWLYSAILAEQQNKVNDAIRDLERSQELNDNRSVFRSRLLLDQDRAIRSANLARIYQDAGMSDWSVREASRAVSYDYANYSAHQFLANSYEALRDPRQINLRYEAPAVSEYFIANLLAPVGATPLSATVSQQEYTRLFDRNHVGIASSTEYFSNGDWIQHGVQYGRAGNTDWALEAHYRTEKGYRVNNDLERTDYTVRLRQQITPKDTLYLEWQRSGLESGDVIQYYDQRSANPTVRIREVQNPNLFLGYHREWSPGNHTLALVGRLDDQFHSSYRGNAFEFNYDADGDLFSTRLRPFNVQYRSRIEGWLAELQQILTFGDHSIVFGGRVQDAESRAVDRMAFKRGEFPGTFVYPTRFHRSHGDIERQSGYLYDMWQVFEALHVTVGMTYDHLSYPVNQEIAPLSRGQREQSRVSPKAGLIWTPLDDTTVRAAYTRSLGGVFFDNSFRLEPTSVAGFNQAFRSATPESVIGNVPGTRFETYGIGFDQRFPTHTYLSIVGEILNSDASRVVGVFDRFAGQIQAVPSSTPLRLKYQERSLSASLNQLVGDNLSFGARYRVTAADFEARMPRALGVPAASSEFNPDLDVSALLHQVQLYGLCNFQNGFFTELSAIWAGQSNFDYSPHLRGDDVWQFNAFVGYRFWRRHAEARVGVLNITDQDYRLNPLTLYNELPRERTFYASFKFYF